MIDEKKAPYIDPSAHVSERAKIGAGTKIWINAQIREDAEIGENCVIGKDVYIDHAVKIGNGVKIQNGVSVFNGVTIEDDVFVGPNAVFTNDYYPRGFIQDWEVSETLVRRGASIGANATIVCRHTLASAFPAWIRCTVNYACTLQHIGFRALPESNMA